MVSTETVKKVYYLSKGGLIVGSLFTAICLFVSQSIEFYYSIQTSPQ